MLVTVPVRLGGLQSIGFGPGAQGFPQIHACICFFGFRGLGVWGFGGLGVWGFRGLGV